jgi:hypothetical protein
VLDSVVLLRRLMELLDSFRDRNLVCQVRKHLR